MLGMPVRYQWVSVQDRAMMCYSMRMKELDPVDLVRALNEASDLPGYAQNSHMGGSASVGPRDTLGGLSGECWCGRVDGHDWAGKDRGYPHPRYPD
jgi:hypothetical protein